LLAEDLTRARHLRHHSARASRLWAERSERQEAHDLLAPAYGWFTDGLDTADLKRARALLDKLS
jgi:predicted ATPase